MERIQVSCGRTIRVVSVFPKDGHCSPEDKLKTLIDLEIQQEKMPFKNLFNENLI